MDIFEKDDYLFTQGENSVRYMSISEGIEYLLKEAEHFYNNSEDEIAYNIYRVLIKKYCNFMTTNMWFKFSKCASTVEEKNEALKRAEVAPKTVEEAIKKAKNSKSKKELVTEIINKWDPINLFPEAPDNEYEPEIKKIAALAETVTEADYLGKNIHEIFFESFGQEVFSFDEEVCINKAKEIIEGIRKLKQ